MVSCLRDVHAPATLRHFRHNYEVTGTVTSSNGIVLAAKAELCATGCPQNTSNIVAISLINRYPGFVSYSHSAAWASCGKHLAIYDTTTSKVKNRRMSAYKTS